MKQINHLFLVVIHNISMLFDGALCYLHVIYNYVLMYCVSK